MSKFVKRITINKAPTFLTLDLVTPELVSSMISLLYKDPDVGDAVLYNTKTNQFTYCNPDYLDNYNKQDYAPIGVVVIPTSHNVYNTGECGIVSLLFASCGSPDTGVPGTSSIYYGSTSISIPEMNVYSNVPCLASDGDLFINTIKNNLSWAYLPTMLYVNNSLKSPDPLVGYTSYSSTNYYAPSPYLEDLSRNPTYYLTTSPANANNMLSDFDGKKNTEILCSKVTGLPNWKTDEAIRNSTSNNYPAACTCWRYHTIGTNQGDWYLPASGELGYFATRYDMIATTIRKINIWCGSAYSSSNVRYWTSSQTSQSGAVYIQNNEIRTLTKSSFANVRPFLRLKLNNPTNQLLEPLKKQIEILEFKVEIPEWKERLKTLGYSNQDALNIINTYSKVDACEEGVSLREGLSTLNYTQKEIEDCIVDVPSLCLEDITYSKNILDTWDPSTTNLTSTWAKDTTLKVFPKIDTSNVTTINQAWVLCSNLQFMPLINTSKVSTFVNAFANGTNDSVNIKRIYDFDYSSVVSATMLMTGGCKAKIYEFDTINLPKAINIVLIFYGTELADLPEIQYPDSIVGFRGIWLSSTVAPNKVYTDLKNASNLNMYLSTKGDWGDRLDGMIFHSSAPVVNLSNFMTCKFSKWPTLQFNNCNNMAGFMGWVYNCPNYVPDFSAWDKVTTLEKAFTASNNYIMRYEGFNFASMASTKQMFDWESKAVARYFRILNLGLGPCLDYDFDDLFLWGVNDDANPDAYQSLVDSLITNSYDRVAAGLEPATIRLHANVKALLTDELKALITAKGFTIV